MQYCTILYNAKIYTKWDELKWMNVPPNRRYYSERSKWGGINNCSKLLMYKEINIWNTWNIGNTWNTSRAWRKPPSIEISSWTDQNIPSQSLAVTHWIVRPEISIIYKQSVAYPSSFLLHDEFRKRSTDASYLGEKLPVRGLKPQSYCWDEFCT